MVVDALASQLGASWQQERSWSCLLAKFSGGWLMKPLTFMNLSGQAVAAARRFYKLAPEEILAVYDDTDMPLGKLRLRHQGSAGGHNGVRSLIQHLGGEVFPRCKVGIAAESGRPSGDRLVGHVLGAFSEDERPLAQIAVSRATDAIRIALDQGMDAAMNLFNRTEQSTDNTNQKS